MPKIDTMVSPQDLADRGATLIRNWFAERYPGEASQQSKSLESKVSNCILAHSSRTAFRQYDVYASIVADMLGTDSLEGKVGAVLGCDWGVSAVYFGQQYGLQMLKAVDVSANYGAIAQSLLGESHAAHAGIELLMGPLERFTNGSDCYDFIVITRSIAFPDTTSGRARLGAVLNRLVDGGIVVVYPQDGAGIITMEILVSLFQTFDFRDVRHIDHTGTTTVVDLVRNAVGRPKSSGTYVAAKRAGVTTHPHLGDNAARDIWMAGAKTAIENWYVDSDYVNVANIRGGNRQTMVNDTITSFCSDRAFYQFDRIVSMILEKTGWENLNDRTGMLFGCDWGFNVLHIASEWKPLRMVGVDVTGKYGKASRKILNDEQGLFDDVEIIDAGPGRMSSYAGQMDFLIVTKSFALLDNGFDRQEFLRVSQVLKPGGVLIFYPEYTPGLIPAHDYPALLGAAGFDEVAMLDWSGKALSNSAMDQAYFVVGRKARALKLSEIGGALKSIGQDTESIMAGRPPIDYPNDENLIDRCERIRENISAGNAALDTLPLRYTMNMLSVCNIKCIFCDYPDRLRHWSLPETFLGDVLDTFDGTLRVQITGGETLMSPSSRDMLERAKDKPYLQLEVITNMTIEKPGLMELLARGASFVTCSIDAATERTYDIIRQDSNFERVVRNLKELVRVRDQIGLHYPHVQINFIVMGHNPHEVAGFMDLAKEIGADSVAYKWLLWTLTPRITEAARFDFDDDNMVRTLCENIVAARDKSIEHDIRIVWGPVPFHIKDGRPDLYAEYNLDDVFGHEGVDWVNPKRIFSETPRTDTQPDFDPSALETAVEKVDEMPDGLMPCTAPFTTMQINGPRNANFCCYSTAEYRAIPIDATGSLVGAWNHPKFIEARQHFIDGRYSKVCRPHCSLFREYIARKSGERIMSNAELAEAKEAAMSTDSELDPGAKAV